MLSQAKWLTVAKNEYRIRTSNIRSWRTYFPLLTVGLLAIYVAVLAPMIVDTFLDDVLAFFLSQVAITLVPLIVLLIFIYSLIIPITYTLQDIQTTQLEIFLAVPIKASDVLIGEFLGLTPFYAIAITMIAGFFTAALHPVGLNSLQLVIIPILFILVILSALWIGTVLAAVLRTKLGRVAKRRDMGRALSLVLSVPMIALMYAIMGGGVVDALGNPGSGGIIQTVLSIFPSTWAADIIMSFTTNPGTIGLEALMRLGGLVGFFAVALWLGTAIASRAYTLEPTTFTASTVKSGGPASSCIKAIGGGGSFGTLLISVFKNYGRRLENLSRIGYVVAIVVLVNVFFGGPMDDLEDALIMSQFMYPFLAVFVVGQVTLGGRESLFIYRKAPFGVSRLVKARFIQSWLVVVPITGVMTVAALLSLPGLTAEVVVAVTALVMVVTTTYTGFSLGLALMNPNFSESSREQMLGLVVNANIMMFVAIGLFLGSMLVFDLPFFHALGLQAGITGTLAIIALTLGQRKLRRIE
ncbi:MAG: ABC transporter permease [Candidatus Bathyarchaeota archaeon]|nr:ABC transporter permease [Candidatus Bathyarchaeota archaeon]